MDYKDYFSDHAKTYAAARPDYPEELFAYLSSVCREHGLAWDCACGNGQASLGLTEYFEQVIATDASQDQIKQAIAHQKIHYQVALAQERMLAADTVDLAVVAQALHWFDLPRFYDNVKTVLKPGGVIAVWCYGLVRVDGDFDQLTDYIYQHVVGPYWPPERKHVEAAYQDLDFPFHELKSPLFAMSKNWSFDELVHYFESWSASQRFMRINKSDPLASARGKMRAAWGGIASREIRWPLTLRIGINSSINTGTKTASKIDSK